MSEDGGYISRYLTHWTGKDGDDSGAEILSIIASTCKIKLSFNRLHLFDTYHEIHEKMVCFTDIPLPYTQQHCARYGCFGIAFHKLSLMNVGAQPVFYASHACKSEMDRIFIFLQEQMKQKTIDEAVFLSLRRHFYFAQQLSEGRADSPDAFYHEREWRLGAQSLPSSEEWSRPNARHWCQQEGYSAYIGRRVTRNGEEYFSFDMQSIAFLIVPRAWRAVIHNPHVFPVLEYEDLVGGYQGLEVTG